MNSGIGLNGFVESKQKREPSKEDGIYYYEGFKTALWVKALVPSKKKRLAIFLKVASLLGEMVSVKLESRRFTGREFFRHGITIAQLGRVLNQHLPLVSHDPELTITVGELFSVVGEPSVILNQNKAIVIFSSDWKDPDTYKRFIDAIEPLGLLWGYDSKFRQRFIDRRFPESACSRFYDDVLVLIKDLETI